MVHMWVNTVTGCGLPRKEINGLRFGPLVDRRPDSSVLVGSRAYTLDIHAHTNTRIQVYVERYAYTFTVHSIMYRICTCTCRYVQVGARFGVRARTRSSP